MRGAGAHQGMSVPLLPGGRVGLWLDEGENLDATALAGVLSLPRAEVWTSVTASADDPSGDQALWLATALPGFCLVTASQQALDDGIVELPWRYGTPALADGPTLAYRTKPRPADDAGTRVEFGVFAHGPQAEQAARLLAGQISAWDSAGRPAPRLEVYPAGTPAAGLTAGLVLDKVQSRFVISWPTARLAAESKGSVMEPSEFALDVRLVTAGPAAAPDSEGGCSDGCTDDGCGETPGSAGITNC